MFCTLYFERDITLWDQLGKVNLRNLKTRSSDFFKVLVWATQLFSVSSTRSSLQEPECLEVLFLAGISTGTFLSEKRIWTAEAESVFARNSEEGLAALGRL